MGEGERKGNEIIASFLPLAFWLSLLLPFSFFQFDVEKIALDAAGVSGYIAGFL
jgi:lipopolysaccharide export LptBFGC system permease protein LptF